MYMYMYTILYLQLCHFLVDFHHLSIWRNPRNQRFGHWMYVLNVKLVLNCKLWHSQCQ